MVHPQKPEHNQYRQLIRYKAAREYSLKRLQGVRPYRQELVKPPLGPKNPESTPTSFLCFREGISYRHRVVKPQLSPKATLGHTGGERDRPARGGLNNTKPYG